ncbi:hypothetical protein C6499_03225 [Candidatus Poribacteria bacterium]|nr:MAG: hypothetical protein C6499_03225 [Candidatus Poribacteria bacterium]
MMSVGSQTLLAPKARLNLSKVKNSPMKPFMSLLVKSLLPTAPKLRLKSPFQPRLKHNQILLDLCWQGFNKEEK